MPRRRVRVIKPPQARKLTLQRTPIGSHAVNPRWLFSHWYGRQLRSHPLRTIAGGVATLLLVAGAAGGTYWYVNLRSDVQPWNDAPDAAVDAMPPFAKYENMPGNLYAGTSVQVVQDSTVKALRFFGAANQSQEQNGMRSQSAGLVPRMPDIQPGQEVWVGMDVKFIGALGTATDEQQIFQVRNNTEGSPSLALTANSGEAGLDVRRNNGPTSGDTAKHALGSLPSETYSRIVIGMQLTRSPGSSWVEVWRDGEPKLLRANWDAFNQAGDQKSGGLLYDNAQSAYLRLGLYRAPQPWDMELYLRDIRVGGSRDSVQ